MKTLLRLAVGTAILALAGSAVARPAPAGFDQRFGRFVAAMQADPAAPPAFAIIVVDRDRIVYQRVHGVRNAAGAPLTAESPIYTASVTKSFVGLIAAQLDAAGTLPLTATLSDIWPGIRLPPPGDPSTITAESLLSHVSGVEAPAIQWRYSDTGEFAASDVPALLPEFATKANRAFDYGNIGPVIYSSMAEARSGRSWRDLLQEQVVRPLGLTHTSARLEDLASSEVAQCNARVAGAWHPVPHKPTALLDAGGGAYSSAQDAATYLRAFISDGRSTRSTIARAVLRRTYQRASVQDRQFFGFHRTGYGLGWDLSEYDGHQIVSRSGGYAGCRTFIAFLPKERLGVVAFSLGDAGGNNFNTAIIQQAVDFWTRKPDADARASDRLRVYAAAAEAAVRLADATPVVPPDRTVVDGLDYVGWYRAKGYGQIAISLNPDGLEAKAGVLELLLAPKGGGAFDAYDATVPSGPTEVRFVRNKAGAVEALMIGRVAFLREAAKP